MIIGFEIGSRDIRLGLFEESGDMIDTLSFLTGLPRMPEKIADSMIESLQYILIKNRISEDRLNTVGIAVRGMVDSENGIIKYSPELSMQDFNILEYFKHKVKADIRVENYGKAVAIAEKSIGASKPYSDAVVLSLGHVVTAGIIIGNSIYSPPGNMGALIGHTVIDYNGRSCFCGRRGCVDAYISTDGLVATVKEFLGGHDDTIIWRIFESDGDITSKTVFDAAESGDPVAKKALNKYFDYLFCCIIDIINLFQPQAICIGGEMSRQGDSLFGPIHDMMETQNIKTKIIKCAIDVDMVGIIGASKL